MSTPTSASTTRWYEELPLRIVWFVLFAVTLSGCGGGGGGGGSSAPPPTPPPPPPPPLGLTISCTPLELFTSETSQCSADVEGTGNAPEWEVSGGTFDSATGVFTAPDNPGNVTITATVRDAGRVASGSVEVLVQNRPIALTVSCTPLELYTFETSQCTAGIEGTDNAPEWEVSDGMVDSAAGLFVAPQDPGTVTITATVRDGNRSVSETVEITVRLRPLTVSRDPNLRDSRTGRTPLHIAALANAPRLIAALVAAGADVEALDKEGITPLHAAAAGNGPAAIAALVEAGADPEARDARGRTPLNYVAAQSDTFVAAADAISALLEAGADPNVFGDSGFTPLFMAIWAADSTSAYETSRAMATLEAMLGAGADPNTLISGGTTPLHWAASGSIPAVVTALLEAGADPNARDLKGWTPLRRWVALGENPAIMTVLLEAGASLETRDDEGNTLLHLAAERDRPATMELLLEAGASLDTRDNDGRTPLHEAAASGAPGRPVASAAAIIVLLEAGADPDSRDNSGYSALQLAPPGSTALITTLLEAHAGRIPGNPNARDSFGYTALHAAARANSPRLIAALAQAGADLDARDNDGHTPLMLAAGAIRDSGNNRPPSVTNPAAIAALALAGADLEERGAYGLTALTQAAIWGEPAGIVALLEAGADQQARGEEDRTALMWALEERRTETIPVLAEAWADLEGVEYRDFAEVLALALGNPAALAETGLDPNAQDDNGLTVLHWAADWADSTALEALAALLDAGANLNARDNTDQTPLQRAVRNRNVVMIRALAEAGADPNVRDSDSRTVLHAAAFRGIDTVVAALVAAGADLEARDRSGWTALQLAAYAGNVATTTALLEAGANPQAQDGRGRTALHLASNRGYEALYIRGPSNPAAVAALLEAGANLDAPDNGGNTPLLAAVGAGNQVTMGMLLALGANWTSESGADPAELNARIVTMELFQGPMVWEWKLDQLPTATSGPGMSEASTADHAKTLLHRAATVALRIGSESPVPMPELSVSLSGADGQSWAAQADLVQGPNIVSLPSDSATGLWETEYVYELPADWVDSGHRASIAIDPFNRIEETDENDNAVTLTMDGFVVPVFDVTFVPIVFSGEPPAIDTNTLMTVIGEVAPIGNSRVRIGRLLDLSGRNLGSFDIRLSKETALRELLHRWNTEAGENEYYHGLLSTAELSFGFGGQAYSPGNVAVSDAIYVRCQVARTNCGGGTHAHEIGHNFGLDHAPGNCDETEPIDVDFPYPDAGIGPRRGWVASRDEFINPGDENRYSDVMSYCSPRFVSDYNYNKMAEHRLDSVQTPPDVTERRGPSLDIGPVATDAQSSSIPSIPAIEYATPLGVASPAGTSSAGVSVVGAADEIGPSFAFAGAVDEYGLWSVAQIDTSTQPPRSASAEGEYFFTLQDAFQREIYREPMTLLTPVHGETGQAWAVRVPVPERPPAFLVILDAQGTPLFIQSIDVPSVEGE